VSTFRDDAFAVVYLKTGIHPGSSPGQAFSGRRADHSAW